eukprot:PhM_4_TR14270/c2_g1_i3/m.4929
MSFRPLTEIVSEFAGVALPDDNVAALQSLARPLKHVKSEAEHKRLMDAIHATQATISAKTATSSPEASQTEHFRKEEAPHRPVAHCERNLRSPRKEYKTDPQHRVVPPPVPEPGQGKGPNARPSPVPVLPAVRNT